MITRRGILKSAALAAPFVTLSKVTKSSAAAAEFSLKWANSLAGTHPLNSNLRAAFEKIKADSNGKIEINLFSDGQLGGDSDMLAQLRTGALEFYTTAGVTVTTLVPAAGIINMPFAFRDYATVWQAMDGDLGRHVRGALAKANMHVFDRLWDNGYRQITSGSKPIKTPEDLKGFKIRVPSSPINASLFKSLGASPAVLNVTDAYTALQARIVDGQENPLVTIDTFKFYEVQKYCAMSNHVWDAFIPVANLRIWSGLPADVKSVISNNIDAFALTQRQDVSRADASLQKQLEGKGFLFNNIETSQFRDALLRAKFFEEWQRKYGPEAWAILEKYAGKFG